MDIKREHKKRPLLRGIAGVVAAAAVTAVGVTTVRHVSGTVSHADRDDIITGEAVSGSFNDYIRLSGSVETGVTVQVSALETGIVETIRVEEGAMVSEGDVILTLRNPLLRQQILDSESQLAEKQNMLRDTEIAMEKERLQLRRDILTARTELNRHQREASRQQVLFDENLTSREEYLRAQEDCRLARENLTLLQDRLRQDSLYRSVQVAMMQESLQNMRENFNLVRQRAGNLDVTASHSGQLGSLTAVLGQNIVAGQQVGQINILDNYKIAVRIDEHYIDRITPGLKGTIERKGTLYGVTVRKVYPEVSEGQFRADLTPDSVMPDNARVGQTYGIDLLLGEPSQAVMVPKGAFFHTTGGKWVYVLSPDGKSASRREISIGRQNPRYYEVLSGLSPGERIIISSYKSFGDADRLEISD